MTPEQSRLFNNALQEVNDLKEKISFLESSSNIPWDVEQAFRERLGLSFLVTTSSLPSGLFDAPLSSITAPVGGAVIDAESRTAINTIITRLETLGLVALN